MKTGFQQVRVEEGFACRSARYLANQGYRDQQITVALVEQLDISTDHAVEIVSTLAA